MRRNDEKSKTKSIFFRVCLGWLKTLKYAELIDDERVKSMKTKNKSQAEILYQLGYGFRRLHKNVPGGIYECNSRCSCQQETCSNRVVQNGIVAQLQVCFVFLVDLESKSYFSYLKLPVEVGAFELFTIFRWELLSAFIPEKFSPANRPMNVAN